MKCLFCGSESGKYHLCFKCNQLKEQGKIEKCADCGAWYDVSKGCNCKKTVEKMQKPEKVNATGVCIVCGENAPNGHLCRDCYYEMRDY